MYEINQDRQLELLKRLLFAWDSQWFLKIAAAFGPDEALKVNARTRIAFGRLEMKAMLALLGKTQAESLADAIEIIKTYQSLAYSHNPILSGISQQSDERAGGWGKAVFGLARCAALDQAKRAAMPINPSETKCIYCIMLWNVWLENLLPTAQIEVNYEDGNELSAPHGVLTINCFRGTEMPPSSSNSNQSVSKPPQLEPNSKVSMFPEQPTYQNTQLQPPTAGQNVPITEPVQPRLIGDSEISSNRTSIQFGNLKHRSEQSPDQPNLNSVNQSNFYQTGTSGEAIQNQSQNKPNEFPPNTSGNEFAPLVPDIKIDPYTGKPLFAGGMEQEIEAGVRGSKKKSFNLISRVMLSKEAQDMLKKSAENPTPVAQPMTLANTLDTILQRLLLQENKERPGSISQSVRFANTPYGDLQIQVGTNHYTSVEEVPASRIKELIMIAIETWQKSG